MEQVSIQLKFQTENHSINAETLIKVMKDYLTLIKESNKELDNFPIIINVDAFTEGSFIVNFGIKIKECFSSKNVQYITNLAAIVGVAFTIFNSTDTKSLSNPVTLNNQTYIFSNDQITNIKENKVINKNITNIYKSIIKDDQINGIEISIDNNHIDSISKTLMEDAVLNPNYIEEKKYRQEVSRLMPQELKYLELDKKIENLEDVSLEIISYPENLIGSWKLLYNGIIINADVNKDTADRSPYKVNIKKGEIVIADIEVTKIWSLEYGVFINKSYKIYRFK